MRTAIKETPVFKYEELSDKAKAAARDWYREGESRDFGGFGELTEPAETAGKILGIEFDDRAVSTLGGNTRYEPKIWWSGFWSQGDGASFEGTYRYAKGSAKKMRQEFPTDKELHRIADGLADLQKRFLYKLVIRVTQSGHYYHARTMDIEFLAPEKFVYDYDDAVYKDLRELMRDFADWIYKGLQEEYEYRTSDEAVEEGILDNEYEFTAEGKIYT